MFFPAFSVPRFISQPLTKSLSTSHSLIPADQSLFHKKYCLWGGSGGFSDPQFPLLLFLHLPHASSSSFIHIFLIPPRTPWIYLWFTVFPSFRFLRRIFLLPSTDDNQCTLDKTHRNMDNFTVHSHTASSSSSFSQSSSPPVDPQHTPDPPAKHTCGDDGKVSPSTKSITREKCENLRKGNRNYFMYK